MDDERAGGAEIAGQGVRAREPPFQRPGGGLHEHRGDYSGHRCELRGTSFASLEYFKVAKSASPLHCTRNTRQLDFRKAKAKLAPPPGPAERPAESAAARLIDGGPWRHCFRARSGYIRAPCRRKSWRTQVLKGHGIKEKGFCLHLLSPKPPLPRSQPRRTF
jgi:hypothetical protein